MNVIKISLSQMIEEVEYELGMRRKVYPGRVSAKKMRQSEATYHTQRMEAVLKTLQWLRENREQVVEESQTEGNAVVPQVVEMIGRAILQAQEPA